MDDRVNNFVRWLQEREDEFPTFSNELIDTAAKAVEEGGYTRAMEAIMGSKADSREKLGMEVILQQLQSSGVDKDKGSYLVRRIEAISRDAGWDQGALGWHT
jgi:hypothetical protein